MTMKKRSSKLRARKAASRRRGNRAPRSRAKINARMNGRHRGAVDISRAKPVLDPQTAAAMKLYAEAMKHFNSQSYRRAKEVFEKVLTGPSRELADRARVHLVICDQRMQRTAPVHLRSADEHYHYAVSQINAGNYEDARAHLEKARKLASKADHVYYALASVYALTGETDEALAQLAQAIKLRPENRYHARHDADFRLLQDEPRFLELIYPDRPAGVELRA